MPLFAAAIIVDALIGYAIVKGLDHVFRRKPETYRDRLTKAIDKTIDEYGKKYPLEDETGRFHFWKSQIIIEELLKYRFFKNNDYVFDKERVRQELSKNPNIIEPKVEEVQEFIGVFEEKLKADKELKQLSITENYQSEIFNIASSLVELTAMISRLDRKTDQILQIVKDKATKTREIPKALTGTIPLRKLDKITGRRNDLEKLKQMLETKQEIVLMNGMGGIGKTTLAEVYVDEYYDNYRHLAWINVEEKFFDALVSNAVLIRNLNLENTDPKVHFDLCLNELQKLPGPNLLVIDNAHPDLAQYHRHLPGHPNWHVLITSRERIAPYEIMELDFLPEKDAIELFRQHCTLFTNEEVQQLVHAVEYHTLTIEVLAKSATLNRWDYAKTCDALKSDAHSHVAVAHSGHQKIDRVKTYLANIFRAGNLNHEEQWILKQFTALPGDYIEYEFLHAILQAEKLPWHEHFAANLEALFEAGFLLKQDNSYKMHAILKEVVQKQLKPQPEDIEQILKNVINLLKLDQTQDNPIDKFPFILYGEAILALFSDENDSGISLLKNHLGIAFKNLGEYEKARDLLEAALQSDFETFGEKHATVASRQSNLAMVYKDLGEYEKARDLLEAALQSNFETFGEKHPTVATRQSNLALVYRNLGEYKKARDLLEAALQSNLENFGEKHPAVAVSKSNLALVYQDLGKYEKARDLIEAALQSDLENFGEKHPNVAIRQSILAVVYKDLGEYEKARDLFQAVLQSDLENFGEKHPNVATTQSNLALVCQDLGKYEKARDLLQAALQSNLKNFGKKHPTVAIRQSNLALVYKDLGEYEKARDLLQAALQSDLDNFGQKHPMVAIRQSNLALVYKDLGEYEKAKDLLEAALQSDLENFGEKHTRVATNQSNLALVYKDLSEFEKARDLLEAALQSDLENFGEKHPDVATRKHNLAAVYKDMGRIVKARHLWLSALDIWRNTLGEQHPNTQTVLWYLNTIKK
jgi:tetratricopeptide (TPR) repeat protein/GTPase SAR1 family protein